jgi:hypothetical protein
MKFGGEQVSWRSFGFKADFFAEMASALTMECIFLDGAAHPVNIQIIINSMIFTTMLLLSHPMHSKHGPS